MQLFLIECHLLYAIPVCDSTFQTHFDFDKLITYQDKTLKTIATTKWNDSPSNFYGDLGVLNLAIIYQLEVAKIMHRIDTK